MRIARSRDEIMEAAEAGELLNLKELAVATGYSYSGVRRWVARGLPLDSNGKITRQQALEWLRARIGILGAAYPDNSFYRDHPVFR